MPDREDQMGALWQRQTREGKTFLSGNVEIDGRKYDVIVFRNTLKQEGERTPDWRIFKSQPRQGQGVAEGRNSGGPGPTGRGTSGGHTSGERPSTRLPHEMDDDIPF